jgi:hypothetical protein
VLRHERRHLAVAGLVTGVTRTSLHCTLLGHDVFLEMLLITEPATAGRG